MPIDSKQLCTFLSACSGNWRNTIHIGSTRRDRLGYLLAFDRDGVPFLITVGQLQHLSGEQIDPAECLGRLTEMDFKNLFAQYLLWQAPSQQEETLEHLCTDKG